MAALTPRTHQTDRSVLVTYDFGAHLAQWRVDDVPLIWCSPSAVLDGSSAIRGGVPICFPWFAAGRTADRTPSHGLARTATWRSADPRDGEVWAWVLTSADLAREPLAPHETPFELRYAVSLTEVEEPALHLALSITNPGPEPLEVEAALHTYVGVTDVRQIEVLGLEQAGYLDKVTGRRAVQKGTLRINGETDRVYDRSGVVRVLDRGGDREIQVHPEGANQTVIWNPWADKAEHMADVGDGWQSFVCVETAATGDLGLTIAPGQRQEIGCVLQARSPHV